MLFLLLLSLMICHALSIFVSAKASGVAAIIFAFIATLVHFGVLQRLG